MQPPSPRIEHTTANLVAVACLLLLILAELLLFFALASVYHG